ncbi:hypothetical protein BU23DRAFT_647833 [Bimuria novae-zelandiae CBS 107.79]|uniref:Rhodopsin domain-containing protein n=1 Tax=Bimuria novae-zelandiae CBS 107.79 TaxID=1447943 RepID=A0A6A5VQI3_9PLEO|nr:hypothetical protein BU23DRAFT_647833 [Bimuria novae-zelandiae CBS 107.79]
MAPTFHVDTSQSRTLLIAPAVFLAVAALSVFLRFRSRAKRKQRLLWDDWLCATSLILSFGCYASIIVCVVYGGLGKTITMLEPEQIPTVFKALFSISVLWATTVSTVQIAILCLYTRIFTAIPWHRNACHAAMITVFCWWTSTFVTTITTCIPVESFWNPMIPGKFINLKVFCIASGLLHVFLDIFILTFPLPMIWGLNTKRSNKITVSAAFLIGLL